MLGSASNFDHAGVAPTGKWIWKDETNTLEFVSQSGQYVDRPDKKKRKGHQDHNVKRNDKITSSLGNRSFGASRANIRLTRSPRPIARHNPNLTFTLDDIKNITLEMFAEVNQISDSFYTLFHTEQYNDFLLHLLNYFHHFFLKLDMDAKPKDMYIEQGIAEIETYADVCTRVTIAQKLLGQAYSVLVMGLGLDEMHHMTCGQSRVSSTRKDRSMYETFYSYCTLFVWVNFKRKDCPTVRREVGRILRSDTFNPAIRVKNAPSAMPNEYEWKKEEPDVKLTPAQYRRLHGKRPAIQSIINQRSPVIISIVPTSKEESHDLFERKSVHDRNVARSDSEYEDMIELELKNELKNLKVGIMGDLVSMYNPQNLMALSAEEKDDNENENANQSDKHLDSSHVGEAGVSKAVPSPEKVSRQLTTISQATTEAFIDDD